MDKAPLNYAAAARLAAGASTNAGSTTHFNAGEASRFLQERWTSVLAELQDAGKSEDDKPKVYVASGKGQVWGQSKLPLQPAVVNFLAELQDALNNKQSPGQV